jgi:hypothetical protein
MNRVGDPIYYNNAYNTQNSPIPRGIAVAPQDISYGQPMPPSATNGVNSNGYEQQVVVIGVIERPNRTNNCRQWGCCVLTFCIILAIIRLIFYVTNS